jgi:hypothetical protein
MVFRRASRCVRGKKLGLAEPHPRLSELQLLGLELDQPGELIVCRAGQLS